MEIQENLEIYANSNIVATETGSPSIFSTEDSPAIGESQQNSSSFAKAGALLVAKHKFSPERSDELKIIPGDLLVSMGVAGSDWVMVRNDSTGKEGLVPINHVGLADLSDLF